MADSARPSGRSEAVLGKISHERVAPASRHHASGAWPSHLKEFGSRQRVYYGYRFDPPAPTIDPVLGPPRPAGDGYKAVGRSRFDETILVEPGRYRFVQGRRPMIPTRTKNLVRATVRKTGVTVVLPAS